MKAKVELFQIVFHYLPKILGHWKHFLECNVWLTQRRFSTISNDFGSHLKPLLQNDWDSLWAIRKSINLSSNRFRSCRSRSHFSKLRRKKPPWSNLVLHARQESQSNQSFQPFWVHSTAAQRKLWNLIHIGISFVNLYKYQIRPIFVEIES